MLIKGLQKLTLLDFPEKMACTVFTFGCNFRCPFCHNASLVLADRADDYTVTEDAFFAFLESRRGILEGVCVTGGEPTLQSDLPAFLTRIREMGFAVKLDTNGSRPAMLKAVVHAGLVDYVAMDIKNALPRYAETVGLSSYDTTAVEESMDFLLAGHVPYEFRTTVAAGLHTPADLAAAGARVAGAERYFLQLFEDSGDLVGECAGAPTRAEAEAMLTALRAYVPNAQIRG